MIICLLKVSHRSIVLSTCYYSTCILMLGVRHARFLARKQRAGSRVEPMQDYYWTVVSKSMQIYFCLVQKSLLFVIAVVSSSVCTSLLTVANLFAKPLFKILTCYCGIKPKLTQILRLLQVKASTTKFKDLIILKSRLTLTPTFHEELLQLPSQI